MACLSAALGLAFGILIGIFVLITARHEKFDHFDDYTYWVPDDGLRYPQAPPAVPDIIPPIVVPETDIYFAKSRIKMLEHFRLVSHFNERTWERRNEKKNIDKSNRISFRKIVPNMPMSEQTPPLLRINKKSANLNLKKNCSGRRI